ncbi:cyclic nucleotide-binding domain-containing thioredoxin-disulfide reductase [Williamsia sp. 1135]|uniref:FAD-dependent oxidoreductase n=1 Tax=Williamsia sp. 1135 TaxID=1889262 RepID=UPI000A11C224|nr:cyclic nucleotide-binding domain-containing thioredoxin-disulfide reductase [Williamsia sp. 1135]ORM35705.1 cyclic nucleotide-binding protein [Williamsia sp. 1135]
MSTRTSSEGASSIRDNPPVDDETPDEEGAFPRLTDDQVATLEVRGSRRPVRADEVLIREGAPDNDFVVVLSGKVAVIEEGDVDNERRILRVHGPGRFLGELGLLEGQVAFFTAEAIEDGEILAVPAEQVRELIAHDPVLSDLILRAYLVRRHLLIGLGSGFRIIGSCFSPDTLRLREFAMRNRLPHRWFDLERDERAEQLLHRLNVAPDDTPVVIWHGEKVLRNPTNAQLARVVGLAVADAAKDVYDLVVVGAGPAGLAASVYGASDGLNTVTLESIAAGGQASTSSRIENYLGFPAGVSGSELAERAVIQAGKFGARILVSAEVTGLGSEAGNHVLRLADGGTVHARAVVLAAGAQYRKLAVQGIEALEGTSVYYAATYQEARICGTDPVAIVGGGNSAGQASVFLAGHVSHVHLLIRGDDLGKSMSRYLVDQIEHHPRVTVHRNTEIRAVHGEKYLDAIAVGDNRTGDQDTIRVRALFVFIGAVPHTGWLADAIALDDHGFVLTGIDAIHARADDNLPISGGMSRTLETSLPGLFAAGDIRRGSVKRVASAVGEGAMAVRQIHEYFEGS